MQFSSMTLANWSTVEPRDWQALDFERAAGITCAHGVALVEDCAECFLAALAFIFAAAIAIVRVWYRHEHSRRKH